MSKIIAISNQKGGCAKTTTTINLGVALAELGKKVLIIDNDPQGNLSMGMGIANPDELPFSIVDLIENEINMLPTKKEISRESYIYSAHGVDFIPSNIKLSYIENALNSTISRENVLKRILSKHKAEYDFILIDCLPSLNILTVNAFSASDEVIIPVQSQYFSAKGLELILQSISNVRRQINPSLKIGGILVTMVDYRANFHKKVLDTVKNTYDKQIYIFNTQIPLSVKVSETQSKGKPIFTEKHNAVADSYRTFANEFVCKVEGGKKSCQTALL